MSKKQRSTALSTIRFSGSNKEDIFAKIKGLVTDMMTKTEAEADATEKAFCDKELSETRPKRRRTTRLVRLRSSLPRLTG